MFFFNFGLLSGPTIIKFLKNLKKNQKNDCSALIDLKINKTNYALSLFKALSLCFLPNSPGPMVTPCPTSIPDSRVDRKIARFIINV